MIAEVIVTLIVLAAFVIGFCRLKTDERTKWEKYIAANTKPAEIDWSIDEWDYSPTKMEAEARNERK